MDVPLSGNVRTGGRPCNQVAQASALADRASGAEAQDGPKAGTSDCSLSDARQRQRLKPSPVVPNQSLKSWARIGDPALRRHVGVMDDKRNQNEGEGSKTADKKYREAATDFAKRTDTEQAGLQAEREVEERKGEVVGQ